MNNVKLSFGDYEAEINTSLGANCVSLKNKRLGADILRTPPKGAGHSYLFGMPILFPVNRISGGKFIFEGREYVLPINEPSTGCTLHGEISKYPFDVTEHTESSLTCVFQNKNGSYMGFPNDFKIELQYVLSESGLKLVTRIKNESDLNMPCFIGFHTTFKIPFISNSSTENVTVRCDVSDEIERNMAVYLPTGRILPPDDVTEQLNLGEFKPFSKVLSRHYKAGESGAIELIDKVAGASVIYENDRKFGWRLIYNGDANEYICLEPQNCMANCANAPFDRDYSGFDYIAPRETKEFVSKLSVIENEYKVK